jgi:hypothetical protein
MSFLPESCLVSPRAARRRRHFDNLGRGLRFVHLTHAALSDALVRMLVRMHPARHRSDFRQDGISLKRSLYAVEIYSQATESFFSMCTTSPLLVAIFDLITSRLSSGASQAISQGWWMGRKCKTRPGCHESDVSPVGACKNLALAGAATGALPSVRF